MNSEETNLFPTLSPDEVMAATHRMWDLSGALPVPRVGWLRCPICGTGSPQPRYWMFHKRSGTPTLPHRCDVSFKCTLCAYAWIHGVALDEDTWKRQTSGRKRQMTKIQWREASRLLEGTYGPADPGDGSGDTARPDVEFDADDAG